MTWRERIGPTVDRVRRAMAAPMSLMATAEVLAVDLVAMFDAVTTAERDRDEALDAAARRLAHIELRGKQAAERTERIHRLEAALQSQIAILCALPGDDGETIATRAIKLRQRAEQAERDRDAALSCYRGACANRDEVAGERDALNARVERFRKALREIATAPTGAFAPLGHWCAELQAMARHALAETGDGNG